MTKIQIKKKGEESKELKNKYDREKIGKNFY